MQQSHKRASIDRQQVAVTHRCVGFIGHFASQNISFTEHGPLREVVRLVVGRLWFHDTSTQHEIDLRWLATFIEQDSASFDAHWLKHDQKLAVEALVFILQDFDDADGLLIHVEESFGF